MQNSNLSQLQKLKRNRLLMIVMTLTLLVVLLWIGISLFSSQKDDKLPANVTQLTSPLNPAIDRDLLESIENKRGFSETELSNFPIYKIIVDPGSKTERIVTQDTSEEDLIPTATPTPKPTTTPLPTVSPTANPVIPSPTTGSGSQDTQSGSTPSPTSSPTPITNFDQVVP